MKLEDVKIGMKVVPHSKTVNGGLAGSVEMSKAAILNQPYLFVVRIEDNVVLAHRPDMKAGDVFAPSDFRPYIMDLPSESPGLAQRFNEGKPQWSLVDFKALEPMVRGLEFGATKYAAHNWRQGLKVSKLLDSLHRHYNAFLDGEDLDPESGVPHIGLMMCNLMFLSRMMMDKPEMDDRFKNTSI